MPLRRTGARRTIGMGGSVAPRHRKGAWLGAHARANINLHILLKGIAFVADAAADA